MNENLNLVEILKDCPKGTKLYSTVFGEVEIIEINCKDEYPIRYKKSSGLFGNASAQGLLYSIYDGECTLFPSKDQRDWSKFKPKKSKFDPKTLKPFDKVLVRRGSENYNVWFPDFVSDPPDDTNNKTLCMCIMEDIDMVIPYNADTKHLVGTKEEAPEFYRYWEDAVDNNEIIRSFIETNYDIIGSYTIKDNIVDVDGDVFVANKNIKSLTNGLFSFGVVSGDFSCEFCDSLQDLKGTPEKVGGNFYCGYCNSLTSLEGAPKEVGGNFDCYRCNSLTTLKGAPAKIGGYFDCSFCNSLTTLEGAPKNVKIIK